MKRVFVGAVLAAASLSLQVSAWADPPAQADVWIGVANTENGFLLDEDTGAAWMTGACLKPLSRARRTGDVWTSENTEMVSVGRVDALLQQTFRLVISPSNASISVENRARGGAQQIDNVELKSCAGDACRGLINAPTC